MAPFLSLPNELITEVISYTYPGDLVGFAATCRRIYQCSTDSLALHWERQRRWSHLTDIDGFSMVDFLRCFLRDHDCAWYLRTMKLWYLHGKICCGRSPHATGPALSEEEVKVVGEVLFETFKLPAQVVDRAMRRLQQGWDESLKVMAMAFAPNLKSVGFYTYNPLNDTHGVGQISRHWMDGFIYNPLSLLCSALHYRSVHGISEGSAFEGLREVIAGTMVHVAENLQSNSPDTKMMLCLSHLPGLKTVVVNNGHDAGGSLNQVHTVGRRPQTIEKEKQCPAPNASTCTHLSIQGVTDAGFAKSLVQGCRYLKYFKCSRDVDLSGLLTSSYETLEELHLKTEVVHFQTNQVCRYGIQLVQANLHSGYQDGFSNLARVSLPLEGLRSGRLESTTEVIAISKLDHLEDLDFNELQFGEQWFSLKLVLGKSMQTIRSLSLTSNLDLTPIALSGLLWLCRNFLEADPPSLEALCLRGTSQVLVDGRRLSLLNQLCKEHGVFYHPIRSLPPSSEGNEDCMRCKEVRDADLDVRRSFLDQERAEQLDDFMTE